MSNKIATFCGVAVAALWLSAGSGPASAGQVDLSPYVNANLDTYYNGGVYPPNGGPITIGGVQFNLAPLNQGTGIIQEGGGKPDTFVIPVSLAGVTDVYTIMNSAFGQFGYDIGSLTFTGSMGAIYQYDLVEGSNIRDHATTFYNDLATDLFASKDFGSGDHLDVQHIVLPSAFASQTLTGITFTALDNGEGDPFLAAITTSAGAVPEPATWATLVLGLGLVGLAARRRREGSAAAA